jgi:hypothetical protein
LILKEIDPFEMPNIGIEVKEKACREFKMGRMISLPKPAFLTGFLHCDPSGSSTFESSVGPSVARC